MAETGTIDDSHRQRPPVKGRGLLSHGRVATLLRSLLADTRLLQTAVRSLFRQLGDVFPDPRQKFTSSLLLKPTQALMLAGIRCAGAGGGGPGR